MDLVMTQRVKGYKILAARPWVFLILIGLCIPLVSGGESAKGTVEKTTVAQRTFASPADAGAAVFEAAKANDQAALLAIFGPDARDVLFSGDTVKDNDALQ